MRASGDECASLAVVSSACSLPSILQWAGIQVLLDFCAMISVLNFLDNVRRVVMIFEDYKGKEEVPKYCDVVVVYFE